MSWSGLLSLSGRRLSNSAYRRDAGVDFKKVAAAKQMISDEEINTAARLLMDQHGDEADLRAAERADYLLEHADMEGAAVWQRIVKAVQELKEKRRTSTPTR